MLLLPEDLEEAELEAVTTIVSPALVTTVTPLVVVDEELEEEVASVSAMTATVEVTPVSQTPYALFPPHVSWAYPSHATSQVSTWVELGGSSLPQ